jgi:hypothetical protein
MIVAVMSAIVGKSGLRFVGSRENNNDTDITVAYADMRQASIALHVPGQNVVSFASDDDVCVAFSTAMSSVVMYFTDHALGVAVHDAISKALVGATP